MKQHGQWCWNLKLSAVPVKSDVWKDQSDKFMIACKWNGKYVHLVSFAMEEGKSKGLPGMLWFLILNNINNNISELWSVGHCFTVLA